MKLVKNKIYNVTESCGMLMLKGKYIGFMGDSYNPMLTTLIFESKNEGSRSSYKYFGAKWEVAGTINEPRFYLRSTHYGDSPESLKSVCFREQKVTLL